MKTIFYAFTLLLLASGAHAADIEAGKAKVHTVCAACHGDIPEMLRNEDWNYAVFTNAKQLARADHCSSQGKVGVFSAATRTAL